MAKGNPPKGGKSLSDKRKYLFAGSALLIVILLIAGIFALNGGDDENIAKAVSDKEVLDKDSPALDSPLADQASKAKREAVNDYLREKGFERDDYCFRICAEHVVDRGPGAVAEEALLTNEDLHQWLTSNDERAVAARERAKRVLSAAAYRRFLTGEDHVRVQFTIPFTYTQNSAYADGQVVLTGARSVGKGDILFVFVEKKQTKNDKGEPEYEANEDGNVRGDCGNPHAVPGPPGGPPKQPPGKPPKGPPPGEPPPGEPPPGEPPGEPPEEGKAKVPIQSIPGSHGDGHLPPKQESDYQGGPPRVKPATPPVVTPPDTGGSIPPGGPPPQNDSAGGTVTQPTAPPTPQPSLPPSTQPPPPPEEGAPPPPE